MIERYVKVGDKVSEYNTMIKVEAAVRRGWNEWDIVREFVQNAMDAAGTASVERLDEGLRISDKGGGFDATAFLIGESTKNPECDRGQFGDGMKMACATALHMGYEVWIHTRGYVFKAALKPTEVVVDGVKRVYTLWFEQYRAPAINGTDVYLFGYYGDTFRNGFLLYDGNDKFSVLYSEIVDLTAKCGRSVKYRRCVMKPEGYLFVRDIYVELLGDSLYSYNLVESKLGVDRRMASVDDVYREIAKVWYGCKDVNLIAEFLKSIVGFENCYEYKANWSSFRVIDVLKSNLDVWKEALKKAFPYAFKGDMPMFYYALTSREVDLVKYYSPDYVYVDLPQGMLFALHDVGFIKSAKDIVRDSRSAAAKIIYDSMLSEEELRTLRFIRRLHEKVVELYSDDGLFYARFGSFNVNFVEAITTLKNLRIYAIEHADPAVKGVYSHSMNYIGITKDSLFSRRYPSPYLKAIEVYSHELVHAVIGGDYESNSVDFMRLQLNILLDIMSLIANKVVRPPKYEL